jgi:hypothetical protein
MALITRCVSTEEFQLLSGFSTRHWKGWNSASFSRKSAAMHEACAFWNRWRRAFAMGFVRDLGKAVESYLDWEVLILWPRPLFASNAKVPRHVLSEVERKRPAVPQVQNSRISQDQENSKMWRRLIKQGNDHCLREARDADWLEPLLQRVQSHPRHVRLLAYGKHWAKE